MSSEDATCPICLEELDLLTISDSYGWQPCCGKPIHKDCADEALRNARLAGKCCWCRKPELPYESPRTHARVLKWANKGKPWACCMVANSFRLGIGCDQSFKQALRYYKVAATQNHNLLSRQLGLTNVGSLHYRGSGVPVDKDKGLLYLGMASALDARDAQGTLGGLYQGRAVPNVSALQAEERAAHLLKCSASAQKLPHSLLNLAQVHFHQGGGNSFVPKSLEKAKALFERARDLSGDAGRGVGSLAAFFLDNKSMREIQADTSVFEELEVYARDTVMCSLCANPQTSERQLRRCPCYLVQYCNKACQKKHRKFHKVECKEACAARRVFAERTASTEEGEKKEEGEK